MISSPLVFDMKLAGFRSRLFNPAILRAKIECRIARTIPVVASICPKYLSFFAALSLLKTRSTRKNALVCEANAIPCFDSSIPAASWANDGRVTKCRLTHAPAFLREHFSYLMANLIGGNNKVFLLEPMLSAESEEICDKLAHIP